MKHLLPAMLSVAAVLLGTTRLLGADAAPRCERVAARTIAFTAPDAKDVLDVSAAGPDCAKAVVTVSIRREDGVAVASFALPLHWVRGDVDVSKPMTPETLGGYLQTYVSDAQLDVAGSTLPLWKKKSATPGFEQGLELTSPLSRKAYEALRKAKPNMLCLRDAFETFACYVWDRTAKRAEIILRH